MSIDAALLATFLEECQEHLETMEAAVLSLLQGEDDAELMNLTFRAAHSIKGSAATFGLSYLADLTHDVETFLDRRRKGERELNADTVDAMLAAVDFMSRQLSFAAEGRDEPLPDLANLVSLLARLDEPAMAPTVGASCQTWTISFPATGDGLLMGEDPTLALKALSNLGRLDVECNADALPTLESLDLSHGYLSFEATLETSADRDAVEEAIAWLDGASCVAPPPPQPAMPSDVIIIGDAPAMPSLAPVSVMTPSMSTGSMAPNSMAPNSMAPGRSLMPSRPPGGGSGSNSIRVSVDKLDALMNMVGELVITHSMLSDARRRDAAVEAFDAALERLDTDTRALQDTVMRIRMLPFRHVAQRLPRVVRDVVKARGKEAELVVEGEDTELDKRVLEGLADPLTHIVRNAVDHGLEPPDERERQGKSRCGVVTLRARQVGGHVDVTITDDGRGVNRAALLRKGIERGIVAPDTSKDDLDIKAVMFAPGLSTATEVTGISGRGVGMDVVARNVEALGGVISIDSEPGSGTSVHLGLPLTTAIMEGQLIRVGDETYVLPLQTMLETTSTADVQRLPSGQRVCTFRDDITPVVCVSALLGTESRHPTPSLFVFAESATGVVALCVDEMLGQQQVVVKDLEANYREIPGIAAATILGNGDVAMILDVDQLFTMTVGHPSLDNLEAAE